MTAPFPTSSRTPTKQTRPLDIAESPAGSLWDFLRQQPGKYAISFLLWVAGAISAVALGAFAIGFWVAETRGDNAVSRQLSDANLKVVNATSEAASRVAEANGRASALQAKLEASERENKGLSEQLQRIDGDYKSIQRDATTLNSRLQERDRSLAAVKLASQDCAKARSDFDALWTQGTQLAKAKLTAGYEAGKSIELDIEHLNARLLQLKVRTDACAANRL